MYGAFLDPQTSVRSSTILQWYGCNTITIPPLILEPTEVIPMTKLQIALPILLLVSSVALAEPYPDWPSWRGPQDNGSTEFGTYPVKFDTNNVLWRAPLPGKGCSTPIVWQQTIYLTAPVQGNDALLSYDWSGKQRWRTIFGEQLSIVVF